MMSRSSRAASRSSKVASSTSPCWAAPCLPSRPPRVLQIGRDRPAARLAGLRVRHRCRAAVPAPRAGALLPVRWPPFRVAGRLMSLVLDSVTKRFGEIVALDNASFTVDPGRIFGLLGANGAGKTTAMRIVLDILRADSGRVTWKGTENVALPRRTWGYLPEERGLYTKMKVGEQLRFFAALYGVPDAAAREEIGDWLERFRIPD